MDSWYELKDSALILHIKAKPGQNIAKIQEIAEDCIVVCIDAPADKNKANLRLVKLLAEIMGIERSLIKIKSGEKCHKKTLTIEKKYTHKEVCDLFMNYSS
ncbi:uncharacterized protein ENBRE01_1203 [Enteropsectra breve]|nr:uncharacterized protein ENBRE01_1203 [Enteropsectra breve]